MSTATALVSLEVIECHSCAINFAVSAAWILQRRRDHRGFYCPNGHCCHFAGKSDVEWERERAERLERALANRDEDLRVERASHSATKGQLTRARKRAVNGVCPCCHRTFANVARHVKTKHPEAVPTKDGATT